MGDLVRTSQRGSYFGKRNRVVMVGTFLGMVAAGYSLRYFKNTNQELTGFYLIFLVASLCRYISYRYLNKKYEPPMKSGTGFNEGFLNFLKDLRTKNYGPLVSSMVFVNFGVFIAAAYYTPHLLKHLKLDYWKYTVLISSVLFFKSITSRFWGEVIDHLGAKKVVSLCSLLICFTTWPWIFFDKYWIILLAQCYTGIVWAGYELSTFTFLLDATETHERTRVTSFFNILNTTAGFLGGVIGALFVTLSKDSVLAFKIVFASTAIIIYIS